MRLQQKNAPSAFVGLVLASTRFAESPGQAEGLPVPRDRVIGARSDA